MMARLHYTDEWLRVWQGDCRDALAQLPERSVHACITSPPFYGLRDYGLPPSVWGGVRAHDHAFGEPESRSRGRGPQGDKSTLVGRIPVDEVDRLRTVTTGAFCECGAWQGCLGLEPSPDLYVEHLVEVFRAVRRVLRDDGILWLNLGDSYNAAGRTGHGTRIGYKQGTNRASAGGHDHVRANAEGLKEKDLIGIPWLAAFALRADGWYLRQDIVWCLSGGARVYAKTAKTEGPVMIKDLVRLDPSTVQLWDGQAWTQVLGWSEGTRDDAIEIEFRTGERIGCTPHHEWPTARGVVSAADIVVGDVVETRRLPAPEAPVAQALDDALTGWLAGMYLAEGSRSAGSIQFAGHINDPARFATLDRVAKAYHGTLRVHQTSDNGVTANMTGKVIEAIIDTYVAGDDAHTKHLTSAAWQRSDRFLGGLAEGYLEGDGHWEDRNQRWRLGFTNNDALAADIRTLAARLGASVRLRRAVGRTADRTFPGWRGEWKVDRGTHFNARPDGEVVAIRRSRARKFWHIGVASDAGCFALASGLMTRNSKPNAMPESVEDRPARSHESIFMLTKNARYFFDHLAVKEPASESTIKAVTARMKDPIEDREYQHDSETRMGKRSPNRVWSDPAAMQRLLDGRNLRDVWSIPTVSYPGAHYATFPPKLVEPMLKASTSEKGCCDTCGQPWRRVTGRPCDECGELIPTQGKSCPSCGYVNDWKAERSLSDDLGTTDWSTPGKGTPRKLGANGKDATIGFSSTVDAGWERGCGHEGEPVPAVVLDPFAGSGTVGMVAQQFSRFAILIDLSAEYLDQQLVRNANLPLGL